MADVKITALAALAAADPINDVIPIVDVNDPNMAASGTTKQISINNLLSSSPTASGAFTVSGLVTAGSATISGDLTVDTNVLKVDTTNNCIGILTATPDADRLVNTGLVIGNGTTARGIMLYGTSSSQQNLAFSDTAASQQGLLQYDHSVDQMKFFTSGALQATLTTTALTIANGDVVMATSGKGIDFSATSSNGTSELLDDYEEGTWTPVLATDNVPFTSVGYIIQVGKYTKVGNLVTVTGTIHTNSVVKGSAIGNVWITGLPFTQPSTDAPGGVNCVVAQSWAVDAPLAGYVYDTKIYLVERATSVSSYGYVSVADVATGGSNNLVRFSGHYYV